MAKSPYEVIRQLVDNPDAMVFDVGANHGNMLEIYRVLFEQPTIHAFEPERVAFETLSARVGHLDRVVLNQTALGDHVGTAELHRTNDQESSSLLPLNTESWFVNALQLGEVGVDRVAVDTVDHYCEQHGVGHIDLLKLDVQGFELECLKGSARMLAERRVKVIQAEVIYHAVYARTTRIADLELLLNPLGYRLFTVFQVHTSDSTGELLYLDTVFTAS